jgi:hypothetical protein
MINDPSEYKIYYIDNYSIYRELHGVNNLSLTKTTSYTNEYLLGGAIPASSLNTPEQLELSFDRSFIGFDHIFSFTGSLPVSKVHIFHADGKYSLRDLYLNNYSAGFSIGELPRISTKFTSYGGELFYPEDEIVSPTNNFIYDIPKLGSISIRESGFPELVSKNIFSFDYNIEINRQPYFSIGQKSADVSSILPLKINLSINSKLTKGQLSSEIDFPKFKEKNYNFNISVSGSGYLMHFPITNSRLISSEVVLSSENTAEIKTQFLGYYGL